MCVWGGGRLRKLSQLLEGGKDWVSFLFRSLNLTPGLRVPQAGPLLPVQIVKSLLGSESDEQSQQQNNIKTASSVSKIWERVQTDTDTRALNGRTALRNIEFT